MEPDFGGYVTKAGLRCTDGRIIKPEAFQHMDGKKVPLVWQHGHNDAANILGHVLLEGRSDGVYGHGFFNKTPNGQNAKMSVEHGDLDSLSIYANQLKEMNKIVHGGHVREVSLVVSGANPGAKIDYVRIQHSSDPDDITELDDEAIIHTGEAIQLPTKDEEVVESVDEVQHADGDNETGEDIYNSLNEKQKTVVHLMIAAALEEGKGGQTAEHSDEDGDAADDNTDEGLAHKEGTDDMTVPRNVFEQGAGGTQQETHTLSHSDVKGIVATAVKRGSLKDAVEEYALKHGIENIEVLFPDAKNITGAPELEKRRTEWVADVLASTRKTPFSRIKTFSGDLTQEDARAKGYIKGNYKLEEWFGVTKRTTTPTTIYKKQKLDRDDILDITDFDIVAWLKAEMRLMTEEEIARAILIGDGRSPAAEDKVKDPMGAAEGAGIRSILNDHELFVTTLYVNTDKDGVAGGEEDYERVIDAVMDGMQFYKGTGTPTAYTTIPHLNMFKKAKNNNGDRYYKTNVEVAEALGVRRAVPVEVLQHQHPDVIAIIVNLEDYNTGTDRGGELTMFDDFDIDYNQYKYLMETRLSGALTKPKSAIVVRKTTAPSVLVKPVKPQFASSTGIITIPTVVGVVYKDGDNTTLTPGAQPPLAAGATKTIYATPSTSGFHFANTVDDSWPFTRPGA